MNKYQKQADQLTAALGLKQPPIAIAFCDEAPANVPAYNGAAPAGCLFWQEAGSGSFVTATKDHELCSIGVHTHNMAEPSDSYSVDLQETMKAMMGLDYVREAEVAAIPVVNQKVNHVVYSPLADISVDPDVVLLFAHSKQGLVLTEAASRVDGGIPPAMGRPACAVVPQVLNQQQAAMSLGCCGARAYLDTLTDDVALWGFPGSKLEHYCEQIATFASANNMLSVFHERRKTDVESGDKPSVAESLQRIS